MNLINRLVGKIFRVEESDVIEAVALSDEKGGYSWYIDPLRVKDISKVRMNRIRTEINDIAIPSVEDLANGIKSVTITYRRRIVYLFDRVFEDIPVMENITEYKNGRSKTREIIY